MESGRLHAFASAAVGARSHPRSGIIHFRNTNTSAHSSQPIAADVKRPRIAAPRKRNGARQGAIVLGGAHGSLEIARSLGRRGIPVWMIIADNPLPTLSRYVECSQCWPGPRDPGAVTFLKNLAERHGLDGWVMFAGGDEELCFVARNHSALSAIFNLTTPSWETIRWTYDKRQMNIRAAELGLAHPLTHYPPESADLGNLELKFPVLLKPSIHDGRNEFTSAKAWRADDLATLAVGYEKAKSLVGVDHVMIQELIPGDGRAQFSYAGIWNRGTPIGSLVAQRRRQYPIDFGYTSTFVTTVKLTEIEQAATRFLESLNFSGLVEVEFKYDERDGSYKILDVNARAWSWIALGAAAGVDFPALQWQVTMGANITPLAARVGTNWRYLSRDIVASIQEMVGGLLSPIDFLHSLGPSSSNAVFAWDDLRPAILDLPLAATRVALRWLSRYAREAEGTTRVPVRPRVW
jgi:D-aspartate ligase